MTVQLDGRSIRASLDRGKSEQWWRIYPKSNVPPVIRWTIQVEHGFDAFKGRIDTQGIPTKAEK